MIKVYKQKLAAGLMLLLILFGVILMLALLSLKKGEALFGTGLPYNVENIITILLSLVSMIKIVHELYIIEH